MFGGSTSRGVYRSLTGGESWSQMNSGLTDTSVYSLAITPNALFAGTYYEGVFRFSQHVTSVHESSEGMSLSYSLSQNYPNPFNPTTTISYQLPENSFVTIKVYDLLGKEIETLVNENKSAGYYKVNFDASKLPSGVYFYNLTTGSNSISKKMLLMK